MVQLTYVGTLATDLDKVRFHLGDTNFEAGPKPEDKNFSDAELTGLVTLEGSWQRAVAAGYEILAALWAKHPTFSAGSQSANQSDISQRYAELAAKWRKDFGSSGATGCGSHSVIREDGYSNDLDNVTA